MVDQERQAHNSYLGFGGEGWGNHKLEPKDGKNFEVERIRKNISPNSRGVLFGPDIWQQDEAKYQAELPASILLPQLLSASAKMAQVIANSGHDDMIVSFPILQD